jgi:hypothetical protein
MKNQREHQEHHLQSEPVARVICFCPSRENQPALRARRRDPSASTGRTSRRSCGSGFPVETARGGGGHRQISRAGDRGLWRRPL